MAVLHKAFSSPPVLCSVYIIPPYHRQQKCNFQKLFCLCFCTFITFLRHLYHNFSKIIFYDIDKKYIYDIMDTRGDKNAHTPKHISAQA